MKLVFNVAPKAVQSFRDGIITGRDGKPRIIRYQTAETRAFQAAIAAGARAALGPGFRPWDRGLRTRTTFVFAVPKYLFDRYLACRNRGIDIYMESRPDLSDNLHKGFLDALKGILYVDDALIVESFSRKIYGYPPRIEFDAELIDNTCKQQELF